MTRTYLLASIQSLYYISTGIWALINKQNLLDVTGPKTDLWLVNLVALLAIVIGVWVMLSIYLEEFSRAATLFLIFIALTFASVDIYYAATDVISDIYLLDAIIEIVFVVALLAAFKEYITRPRIKNFSP